MLIFSTFFKQLDVTYMMMTHATLFLYFLFNKNIFTYYLCLIIQYLKKYFQVPVTIYHQHVNINVLTSHGLRLIHLLYPRRE